MKRKFYVLAQELLAGRGNMPETSLLALPAIYEVFLEVSVEELDEAIARADEAGAGNEYYRLKAVDAILLKTRTPLSIDDAHRLLFKQHGNRFRVHDTFESLGPAVRAYKDMVMNNRSLVHSRSDKLVSLIVFRPYLVLGLKDEQSMVQIESLFPGREITPELGLELWEAAGGEEILARDLKIEVFPVFCSAGEVVPTILDLRRQGLFADVTLINDGSYVLGEDEFAQKNVNLIEAKQGDINDMLSKATVHGVEPEYWHLAHKPVWKVFHLRAKLWVLGLLGERMGDLPERQARFLSGLSDDVDEKGYPRSFDARRGRLIDIFDIFSETPIFRAPRRRPAPTYPRSYKPLLASVEELEDLRGMQS